MPDDLRTRIAKALHRLYGPSLGAHPDGWDREPRATHEMYLADADAVLAELGLRQLIFDLPQRLRPVWGADRLVCYATPFEPYAEGPRKVYDWTISAG